MDLRNNIGAKSIKLQELNKNISWSGFPRRSLPLLKEKEEKQYGEYHTRRLVLEAWDKLEKRNRFENDHRVILEESGR